MSHPADEAISALVRNVAQATVERCADRLIGNHGGRVYALELLGAKDAIAEDIVVDTLETADECPEAEIHAVRALDGGAR